MAYDPQYHDQAERDRIAWRSRHPQEDLPRQYEQMHEEGERMKERVRQHKPKVLDVQSDGEYLTVEFTRANGERVSGMYKLGLGQASGYSNG
jgi:hypothetical protein